MKILERLAWIGLAATFLLFPAPPALGQSFQARNLGGFSLGGLFPTGAFNDHVSQEGYGLAGYYAKRIGAGPLLVGLEFTYSEYGHSRRVEYLEGIPEVGVNVDTTNSIAQSLLLLRLQPRSGRVMSFVEALAGVGYLWTESAIGDNDDDDVTSASETNFDDWTWTAGVGAGISFRLRKWQGSGADIAGRGAFLELKARYMAGGRAEYLKKGSIIVVGNEYSFTPERSATSAFTVQVGLSWFF
jgi:hypothetical protein